MMKKVIAVGSVTMMAGFALALANADDSTYSTSQGLSNSNTVAQNTCIDNNGVTFHRGDKGFADCQKQVGQMSGTAGNADLGNGSNTVSNPGPSVNDSTTTTDTSSNNPASTTATGTSGG
jgi:hypothetical protein